MKVQKAGTILLNLEMKKVGLVYRPKKNDYSFPKGHLEVGETLQECAIRETEEETLRANHLVSEQEIDVSCYITPSGEDTECHMYIAIDDGPTTKNIPLQDREEFHWFSVDEIEKMLTYEDLKALWKKALPNVLKLFFQD